MSLFSSYELIEDPLKETLCQWTDATLHMEDGFVHIHLSASPYSIEMSYFNDFGWQAFLIPTDNKLVEHCETFKLYKALQEVAQGCNDRLGLYQSPETHLFLS